jgi:hypothetical protein
MAGIKQSIEDVLAQLATIMVDNQDGQNVPMYTRIFNNQPKRLLDGKLEIYPLPASFVEVIKPTNYNRLLNGISESDCIFRIHLQHWFIDAMDGTFSQDLLIYDQRDAVIAKLSNFKPTGCSNLFLTGEEPDYEHDDTNEYMIDFTCGFIDTKGSPYDIGRTDFINTTPPTNLNLIVTKE